MGIEAIRIIVSRVVTYEFTNKDGTDVLIAAISGLSGYISGNIIEKGEGIIEACEKRKGKWVRL